MVCLFIPVTGLDISPTALEFMDDIETYTMLYHPEWFMEFEDTDTESFPEEVIQEYLKRLSY